MLEGFLVLQFGHIHLNDSPQSHDQHKSSKEATHVLQSVQCVSAYREPGICALPSQRFAPFKSRVVVSRGRRLVMGLSFLRVPVFGSFKRNQRDT